MTVFFLEDYTLEWCINKKVQKPKVVANLTWAGFKGLCVEWFTLKYKKLCEGMNFMQKEHARFLKAYMRNFNV